MASSKKFVTHYAKDGERFMVGHCGANSTSSAKNLYLVTCDKCLGILSAELGETVDVPEELVK